MSIERTVLTSMDPRKDYAAFELVDVIGMKADQVASALRRLVRGGGNREG